MIPVCFVDMILGALLPWKIKSSKRAILYMGLGLCFSAGIIIGAAFSHMMPEASRSWDEYLAAKGLDEESNATGEEAEEESEAYPYTPLIAIGVMIILFSADTLAHSAHDKMSGHKDSHAHCNHLAQVFGTADFNNCDDLHNCPHNDQAENQNKQIVEIKSVRIDSPEQKKAEPVNAEGAITTTKRENNSPSQAVENNVTTPEELPEIEKERGTADKVRQAWIFFGALSLHSIIDGMSLGATSELSEFYPLMIAMIIHKGLDGFALGVPLFYAKLPTIHTVLAILFCCMMTPLGTLIGIIFSDMFEGRQGMLAQAVILSVCSGSFIFIGLVEIMPAGFATKEWVPAKLAMLTLGWGIMALLALYA